MQTTNKFKYGVLFLAIALYWVIFFNFTPSPCIFKNATGLPCPGCGLTRSGLALLRGQWQRSLYYHALLLPIVMIIALNAIGYLKKIKAKYLWVIIVILFTYYFVRLGMYFPDKAPLDYQENNILSYLLKLIHKP